MQPRLARIDRRLPSRQDAAGTVAFHDAWGEVSKRYDLTKLSLPADVTQLLAAAFNARHAASTAETQRHCWKAMQLFARFVAQDGAVCSAHDLTTAMVGRYRGWLDKQKTREGIPWTPTSKANKLAELRYLIEWTKRQHPALLTSRIDFPRNPYPNRVPQHRAQLPERQLKAILRACYEEIEEAWARFESGRKILASDRVPDGLDPELCQCVRTMAAVGGGVMPTMQQLKASGFTIGALDRHGGLRALAGYLHLMLERLAAFFVAIAIQTAGNPDALRQLRCDCQAPHPLDEHRVMIDWRKARAGVKIKRAQRRSFDRRAKYAAPNLIDRVLVMTEPLRAHARIQDRHLLFLIKSEKRKRVTEVSMSSLGKSVKRFVTRTNARLAIWNEAAPERRRELLPDFAAVLLRGSVATAHYKASGGDILEVQALLNHAHVHTTDAYVSRPEAERVQAETIARLQSLMIAWVSDANVNRPVAQPITCDRATAPFGHDCLNPLAGTAAGTEPNRLCPWFGGCLRCPGLVIPLDAEHLARLLNAKEALESARNRLDPNRWMLLYAPTYNALVNEILPDFKETLYPEAQMLIKRLPQLPVLE